MAVCDPVDGMHTLFAGTVPEHVFADRPPAGFDRPLDDAYVAQLSGLMERHSRELAAVILEPVVQGAGGMRFYSPAVVRFVRELCDRHDVLLVLDEIATGFGRTGMLFASDHAGVAADVMCLGKALTGGYMTLGATLCTREIAEQISQGPGGALMHGPTFMANPLACAVALASLDLLDGGSWRDDVARIARGLNKGLTAARDRPRVRDVRVLGAVGVIQLDRPVRMGAATRAAVNAGVWLRPFRDLIYTMPPYVTDDDDVAAITAAMIAAVDAVAEARG
jgi:adenosylmethionine---8-amino-7-oxononanoate aminotransferase